MHNSYCQSRNYINCCYKNPIFPANENTILNTTNSYSNNNLTNNNCNNNNYYPTIPASSSTVNNINRHNSNNSNSSNSSNSSSSNREYFYPWPYNHQLTTNTPTLHAINNVAASATTNEKYSYNTYNYNSNCNIDYNYNLINNKCDYTNIQQTTNSSNYTTSVPVTTTKLNDYRYHQLPLNTNLKNNYQSYHHQSANNITTTNNSNLPTQSAHYNYDNRLLENTCISSHQLNSPSLHQSFHHQQQQQQQQLQQHQQHSTAQSNSNKVLKQSLSTTPTILDYHQCDASKNLLNSNSTPHYSYYAKECYIPRYPETNTHQNSISIRNPFEYPDETYRKSLVTDSANYELYKKSQQLDLVNYETYKKSRIDSVNLETYRKVSVETPPTNWNNNNYINNLNNPQNTKSNANVLRHQRFINQDINIWTDKRYHPNYSTVGSNNYQQDNKIVDGTPNCFYESQHSIAYPPNNEKITDTINQSVISANDFYNYHHQQRIEYYNNGIIQNNNNILYEYNKFNNVQESNSFKEAIVCGQAIRDFISNWNEEEDDDVPLPAPLQLQLHPQHHSQSPLQITTEIPQEIKINNNDNSEQIDSNKIKEEIIEEEIKETKLLKVEKAENQEIKTEVVEKPKDKDTNVQKCDENFLNANEKDQFITSASTVKNKSLLETQKSKSKLKKIRKQQQQKRSNKTYQTNLKKEQYKIIRKIYKIKCFYTKYVLPKNKFLYKKMPLSKRSITSNNFIKNHHHNHHRKTNRKIDFVDYKNIKKTYRKRLQRLQKLQTRKKITKPKINLKEINNLNNSNVINDINIINDKDHETNSTKSDIPSLIDICEQFIINETIKSGCNLNVYLYEAYNYNNNNNNFDDIDDEIIDDTNIDNNNEQKNISSLSNTDSNIEDTKNLVTTTIEAHHDTNLIENNEIISSSSTTNSCNNSQSINNSDDNDNDKINNNNNNNYSPPSNLSIHHEEIVPDNVQKFHLEKFAKDLRTKYLNKCSMKNYFISKLYKRYKWRTKF